MLAEAFLATSSVIVIGSHDLRSWPAPLQPCQGRGSEVCLRTRRGRVGLPGAYRGSEKLDLEAQCGMLS